jgi:hypothetical protein
MGERDLAVGVERRPGEGPASPRPASGPTSHQLAFWPDQPQPVTTDDGWAVYRMALTKDGRLRALVDIPVSTVAVLGLPPEHVRRVIGSVAARQLTRLAARGRLPADPPLMPLRLVGLDPHVARQLDQGQLDLEPAAGWTVVA